MAALKDSHAGCDFDAAHSFQVYKASNHNSISLVGLTNVIKPDMRSVENELTVLIICDIAFFVFLFN